jgi:MYXO-CTERM domain-containing protein
VTFDTAGTFPYHCSIHSSMHGTIVVDAAAPATDTIDPERGRPMNPAWLALGLAALLGLELGRRRFRSRAG